ncbi:glycosyltransferase [Adhaeribacter sp. BT258]|uniref:Glycosyltransferase n=1 Tax=Adhaeribacter terrigena TaxID=2793070 RepID=A0ABS1C6A5_9BACT|nr:glycosyltransferase [Adhaeribacter terrigena]MBK0404105.1 glycosyltransferase [Adhaeribacter terrigena]
MPTSIKPNLFICTSNQFGYLTDTYKYCEYGRHHFNITYLCWDYNLPKIELNNVSIIYINRNGNLFTRNFRLLQAIYDFINKNNFKYNFIVYIRGISIVKLLLPTSSIILDIRTASVHTKKSKRIIYNSFLRIESIFFKRISVISEGVANSLRLKKFQVLPLGGDNFKPISSRNLILTFIYVGTLAGRDIITFVKAFYQFCLNNSDQHFVLKIIGDSPNNELEELQDFVNQNQILNIELLGRVNQKDLHKQFLNANIGVSYIPIKPWYEFQPPTKTFEYLVSGLPVIATSTFENKKIIRENNGVLIDDNFDSIINGLEAIKNKFYSGGYDENLIKSESEKFSWKFIVENFLKSVLENGTFPKST